MTNEPNPFVHVNPHDYDHIIVTFSGGKDSMACFLLLLDMGVPKEKIELWHHDVDGHGKVFMDWECTPDYCRKFAEAFDVPVYFSWKEGGFLREMLRENQYTAPIWFETPDGPVKIGGGRGKLNTRRKFPQISPSLMTRWCSAYLKIDVGSAAIRNQKRFNGKKTLVLSGERGEESKARSNYAMFERDRSDARNGRTKRHVDRWRPIRDWKEKEVWDIIKRYNIRVHPAYYLGWGRVSCKYCIFGNSDQFASAFKISPEEGKYMIELEESFGYTMKRKTSLLDHILKGVPYSSITEDLAKLSISKEYTLPIFLNEKEPWILPAGAFGESCGPT